MCSLGLEGLFNILEQRGDIAIVVSWNSPSCSVLHEGQRHQTHRIIWSPVQMYKCEVISTSKYWGWGRSRIEMEMKGS